MSKCVVVIVNWNSWEYLYSCLESVSQQTFREFRVVVVDNNSETPGRQDLCVEFPFLTLITNDTNVGFAAANNAAIQAAADCEWVVLLNPDTLPRKDWLERLCNAAAVNPEFSFFGSRLVMAATPDTLDGTGDVYHMSGLSWRAGHGVSVTSVTQEAHEIFSPCAAAAMYRRKDLLAVGGFDEDFFCYNEDVDLGFRLRLAGHRALSVPDSIVLHHGSATTSIRSDFAVYHGHRNLVWTWFKDMPLLLLLLFLPIHVAYNIACVLLYLKRGQGRVILRAKWDAIKGLGKMWAKRKGIHDASSLSSKKLWKAVDKHLFVGPQTKYKQNF